MSKNIIAASTSTIYGGTYLEYLLPELKKLFHNVTEIIFIPYARPGGITHDDYTAIAQKAFAKINISVKGLHTYKDATEALKVAQGIFTGGGNTFVLVNQLYKLDVMHTLRDVILNGTPYLGTSAGSNLCGLTMQTTNDMPIAYPPSFKTLGVLPFNVNPHYLDPDIDSTHMGETRETRIKEYHIYNTVAVLGIREGSWIRVKGKEITLQGDHTARVFKKNEKPYEIEALSIIKL